MKTFLIDGYKSENGYMSEAKCVVVANTEEAAVMQFYDYHRSLRGGGKIVVELDLTKTGVNNIHIDYKKISKK